MSEPELCITQTAAAIDALLGVPCHEGAAEPLAPVPEAARKKFGGEGCTRVFYYNPDAVALWIYEKYRAFFEPMERGADLVLPLRSVVPPVTPVCFASMYSGLQPEQHGIRKYEKPVLKVPTVFDDLAKAGKRAAIVSTAGDSISEIFLGRDIDYFIYKTKQECNEKALELIAEGKHDFTVLYNGDYDHWMHRFGPEGKKPLRSLRENIETYCALRSAIAKSWAGQRTLLAFAPDHGCHARFGIFGDHGIDQPSDMQIPHFYTFL